MNSAVGRFQPVFGQKKRVTIGYYLGAKSEIILLDEPTAGQDQRHYKK